MVKELEFNKVDHTIIKLIHKHQDDEGHSLLRKIMFDFHLETGKHWHETCKETLTKYLKVRSGMYNYHRGNSAGTHSTSLTDEVIFKFPEYAPPKKSGGQSKEERQKMQEEAEKKRADDEAAAKKKKEEEAEKRRQHQKEEQKREEMKKKQEEEARQAQEKEEAKRLQSLSEQEQQVIKQQSAKVDMNQPKGASDEKEVRKHQAAYATIDQHVANIRSNGNVKELTASLIQGKSSHEEKARAIYTWVAKNIRYNTDENPVPCKTAEEVIQNGKALSCGYTALFKRMCQEAQLPCVTIVGNGKGAAYYVGKDISTSGHTWNAFQVEDGTWRLADPCWGAGYQQNGVYVHEFVEWLFSPKPEDLINSHFPEKPQWQLLDKPITMDEFGKLVRVMDEGITAGLKPVSHKYAEIELKDENLVTLQFQCDPQYEFLARLETYENEYKGTTIENLVMVERTHPSSVHVSYIFPQLGEKYHCKVYGRQRGTDGKYKPLIHYVVNVSDNAMMNGVANGFPMAVSRDHHVDCGVQLLTHKYRIHVVEDKNHMAMQVGLNEDADLKPVLKEVIDGKPGASVPNATLVQRFPGDAFVTIQFAFPRSGEYQLGLYVKKLKDSGNYNGGITYSVFATFDEQDDSQMVVDGFPTFYAQYKQFKANLSTPLTGKLCMGSSYPIKVSFPNDEEKFTKVALVQQKNWVHLEETATGVWEGTIPLIDDAADYKLYVKRDSMDAFKAIVMYKVKT